MIKFDQVGQYKLIFEQLHALGHDRLLRLRGIGDGGDDGDFEKG